MTSYVKSIDPAPLGDWCWRVLWSVHSGTSASQPRCFLRVCWNRLHQEPSSIGNWFGFYSYLFWHLVASLNRRKSPSICEHLDATTYWWCSELAGYANSDWGVWGNEFREAFMETVYSIFLSSWKGGGWWLCSYFCKITIHIKLTWKSLKEARILRRRRGYDLYLRLKPRWVAISWSWNLAAEGPACGHALSL